MLRLAADCVARMPGAAEVALFRNHRVSGAYTAYAQVGWPGTVVYTTAT